MKRIQVTMALIDDNGAAVHQRQRTCYITKATPDRPMMLQGNRSLSRHFLLCDLDRFWTEVVMLGFLDENAQDWHMPPLPDEK